MVYNDEKESIMIAYIDESDHPRQSDPTSRPVLLAVCIKDEDVGTIVQKINDLK